MCHSLFKTCFQKKNYCFQGPTGPTGPTEIPPVLGLENPQTAQGNFIPATFLSSTYMIGNWILSSLDEGGTGIQVPKDGIYRITRIFQMRKTTSEISTGVLQSILEIDGTSLPNTLSSEYFDFSVNDSFGYSISTDLRLETSNVVALFLAQTFVIGHTVDTQLQFEFLAPLPPI